MDKTNLKKVKVYLNVKGKRTITKGLLVKENKRSIWVVLSNGDIVKRSKKRDIIGGNK